MQLREGELEPLEELGTQNLVKLRKAVSKLTISKYPTQISTHRLCHGKKQDQRPLLANGWVKLMNGQ